MRGFEYASPTTKEQAVSLLGNNWADADILAGGTDLLALMKDDVVAPKRLVNIKDIPELRGITVGKDRSLRIGALVTIQELVDHSQTRQAFPVIAHTAGEIAGPQIRNMATVGGNSATPECWYYRAASVCWQRIRQVSRWCHWVTIAITRSWNTGPAFFVSPSTLGTLFIALEGRENLRSKGKREVRWRSFSLFHNREPTRARPRPNEIVTEIWCRLLPVKNAS